MKRLIPLLFLLFITPVLEAQQPKKLLAVVAHPDDETAFAEVLLKYARQGYKVYLVIATDGKDGTRVTSVPAGDSLGNLRKQESLCASQLLGIEPPVFLGVDRLDTRHGVGQYFKSHEALLKGLKAQLLHIDPDLILSFGPDGDTHHAEHIVIGAAITELLLREGWVEEYPLYYLAWTKEQGRLFGLGFVDQQYFNVRVSYSQAEEDKALEIMPCYKTQYTAEEIKADFEKKLKDKSNALYFRRFAFEKGIQNGF